MAEDVRLYSQETWRVTRGVQLVKQHIHKDLSGEFPCLEYKYGQASQIHDISVAQIVS